MTNNEEILPNIGQRLKDFRKKICISLIALYDITGISNATLSRIERGFNHNSKNIEILSQAFGVSELEFRNNKINIPARRKLINNLKEYVRKTSKNVNVDALLEGKHTAHFLDLYIEEGYLNEYQTIKQICTGIKEEYDISLVGPDISNLLKHRIKIKLIETRAGQKKGTFEYRKAMNGV